MNIEIESTMNPPVSTIISSLFLLSGAVIRVIEKINGPRMTAIDVKALGDEVEDDQLEISVELESTYTTIVKLEIICVDECIERVKETIPKHARTGYKIVRIMRL